MSPPRRPAQVGCLLFVALALFPLLFLPFWPYSARWGWWPLFWVLAVLVVLALPTWPYSRAHGYYPSLILGFFALGILAVILLGRV